MTGYSKFTLKALLEQYGFEMTEFFTCYDKPPLTRGRKLAFSISVPYFKAMPERGGTLLAISKKIA